MYTAPTSVSGTDTVQATGGGLAGSATVSYASAPLAPSNLTGVAVSSHQVNLSWRTNSTNQTGFVIQRKTGSGNWTQIATVGANVTSYSDTSVTHRKTYSYRVYAYNSFGNSPYSNTVTVVTPNAGVLTSPTGNDGPAAPGSQTAPAGVGAGSFLADTPSGRSSTSGSGLLPARQSGTGEAGGIDSSGALFVLDLLPGNSNPTSPGTNTGGTSATGIWFSGAQATPGAGGIAGQGLSSWAGGKAAGSTAEAGGLETLFADLWAVLGDWL
jgi:hypothetical protein